MSNLLDAMEDFRLAADLTDLWRRLDQHLIHFGIDGSLYGTQAIARQQGEVNYLASSIRADWLKNKLDSDLFYCDAFVRYARVADQPTLWADLEKLKEITHLERESVEMDYDYGIITGVTIPMPFANGLGTSSIGCHASNLSFQAFQTIWDQNKTQIKIIVNAFDFCLRGAFTNQIFNLNQREKELLLNVAAGHRTARVADRMKLTERQIATMAERACKKLNAVNLCQAIAVAVILGVINP